MFRRFKNLKNTLLTSALSLALMASFWDLVRSGNSLLLFGEPEFPTEE